MLAYALISKPCSETTDIGYIFFGGSICSNLANMPSSVAYLMN